MFDLPHEAFEPEPPDDNDLVRRVLRVPGMRQATVELIAETAERLDVHSPVTPQDLQRLMDDRRFRQRFGALVEAVMFT